MRIEGVAKAVYENKKGLWLWEKFDERDPARERKWLSWSWPVWRLGTGRNGVLGFRMSPKASYQDWPLVQGKSAHVQFSTSGAAVVPLLLWRLYFLNSVSQTDRAKCLSEWSSAEFEPLHSALGGTTDQLTHVHKLVVDSQHIGDGGESIEPHFRRMLEALDPAPSNLALRAFLERQFASKETLIPPSNLGVWQGFGCAAAFARSAWGELTMTEHTTKVAWQLLHQPPQFDFGQTVDSPTHYPRVGGGEGAMVSYAMLAIGNHATEEQVEAWSSDPLMQTVFRELAKDKDGPWHLAYMEAAAAYDGLGQPEMAWTMLCYGQFWMVRRRGGDWRVFFDAALALAKREGWSDAVWAMEDMATAADLD